MSKITIKVCGTAGAGKSTVAELLTMFLKNNDFNATHISMEELDVIQRAANRDKRFASIRDNCEIEIVEEMALRSSIDWEK